MDCSSINSLLVSSINVDHRMLSNLASPLHNVVVAAAAATAASTGNETRMSGSSRPYLPCQQPRRGQSFKRTPEARESMTNTFYTIVYKEYFSFTETKKPLSNIMHVAR